MALKAYIEILRPLNCLMAAIATFIGYAVSVQAISFTLPVFYAMLSAFLICGAGQTINDFFDLKIDRKLRPEKPLSSGKIRPQAALIYSIALFALGNISAFIAGFTPLIIALIFTALLIVYSAVLAKLKYVGNWVVAAGTAFTLIFGASISGNYSIVIFFAVAALFANVSRELIKDLEDISADKGFKQTLPIVLGKNAAKSFAYSFYFIAAAVSYIAAVNFNLPISYVLIVSIANLGFVYSAFLASKNNFSKAQQASKAAMVFALIAFLSVIF